MVQWGGPGETQVVLPFTQLNSGRDSKAFGFRMELIHRFMWASATSIATGITDSAALIEGNEFDGQRKVIDVAGDGDDVLLSASVMDGADALDGGSGVDLVDYSERIGALSTRQKDVTGAPVRSEPKLGKACAWRPSPT